MKAQALSIDLFFAITVILLVIAALGIILDQFVVYESHEQTRRDMDIKALNAINSLTNTPGNPSYWEEIVKYSKEY